MIGVHYTLTMSRSSNHVSVSTGGVFPALLGVLFIGLKLTGHVNWPWIWVLSPLWVPLAVTFALIIIGLLIYAIYKLIDKS